MVTILEKKIDDPRFLDLIRKMLKAGYLEDWTYHKTYSGTPQGGVCSPILANIYLHELDQFMESYMERFKQGKERARNREYTRLTTQIRTLRGRWDRLKRGEGTAQQQQALKEELRQLEAKRHATPSADPQDAGYKRMRYCRYADDFLIGVIGTKRDAQSIMNAVKSFVHATLKLSISEEKSSIQPAQEGTKFLGYWIRTYTGEGAVKKHRGTRHTLVRTISESVQLRIPKGKSQQFCQAKRYGNYALTKALHRPELTILSDAEIVLQYNGELRGFANFYALAQNAKRDLGKLEFMWRTSLFKTLANKHRTSVQKIADQLKTPTGYTLVVQEEKRTRVIPIFLLKNLHTSVQTQAAIDLEPNTAWVFSRTEIIRRLSAKKCEYCGAEGAVAVHHIRKLKDVSKAKERWQRLMIARRRKTLVMCVQCHTQLHNGTLPSPVITQEGA